MTRMFLSLLIFCTYSCGKGQPDNLNDPKSVIESDSGSFHREYVVERNIDIKNPFDLESYGISYFPEQLPKGEFGENIFWTFAQGTTTSVDYDPGRNHYDDLSLHIRARRNSFGFNAIFHHNKYDELTRLDHSNWLVEFRPLVYIKQVGSLSSPVRLRMDILDVCAKVLDGRIEILEKHHVTRESKPITTSEKFQSLSLQYVVYGKDYMPFFQECLRTGGFVSSSLELADVGGQDIEREIQFVDLRIIKNESF